MHSTHLPTSERKYGVGFILVHSTTPRPLCPQGDICFSSDEAPSSIHSCISTACSCLGPPPPPPPLFLVTFPTPSAAATLNDLRLHVADSSKSLTSELHLFTHSPARALATTPCPPSFCSDHTAVALPFSSAKTLPSASLSLLPASLHLPSRLSRVGGIALGAHSW